VDKTANEKIIEENEFPEIKTIEIAKEREIR
jgi:hypothetical protein